MDLVGWTFRSITPVELQLTSITRCPEKQEIIGEEGLQAFFEAFVAPNLPAKELVEKLHRELEAYVSGGADTFIIRDPAKGLRRMLDGGVSVYGSDNEAALWFWTSCQPHLGARLTSLETLMRERSFPIGNPRSRKTCQARGADWPTWAMGDEAWRIRSGGGWKHCHIFDASPAHLGYDAQGVKARMVRLLHPLNHFLFPTPFNRLRGGFVFELSGLGRSDPGEDAWVKRGAAMFLAKRYGQALYEEFLALVKAAPAELRSPASSPTIRFERHSASTGLRSRSSEEMGLDELYENLLGWYLDTRGQPDNTRLDGKAAGTRGGIGKARLLGVVESVNQEWNYNTTFQIAGDTQRHAVGLFLKLYERHEGAYEKIFSEVGRSRNGQGGTLKLALSEETTGWQVLSVQGWEALKLARASGTR